MLQTAKEDGVQLPIEQAVSNIACWQTAPGDSAHTAPPTGLQTMVSGE